MGSLNSGNDGDGGGSENVSYKVDCKTVRIFVYSSTGEQSNKSPGTRLKTESETEEGLARGRHPLPISLLFLREKNPTVLQSTHKVNSRCFKICRSCSLSFILSNVVEIFWSLILRNCNVQV